MKKISILPAGAAAILLAAFLLVPFTSAAAEAERIYTVEYLVRITADEPVAEVHMKLEQPRDLVRELRFGIDPARHTQFEGDGTVEISDDTVLWKPPRLGGELRWRADLESQRKNGAYDGLVTPEWAIFRGDDLIPPAYTRSLKGSRSQASLKFELPESWSAVTPYPSDENDRFLVEHDDRNFDRPTGWMALGDLGVRWASIADTSVAVAGPKGQDLQRQDMLAFLQWTLPVLKEIFPSDDDRLLLVGAGDPMWRGGLSGPASMYIHAERPLISENGTSTLLHELVHVFTSIRAGKKADWIIEGIAEYYALQVLLRSGTIDERRFEKSMSRLAKWGKGVKDPRTDHSTGKNTAQSVQILARVDEAIREGSDQAHSLDDVVRTLMDEGKVTNKRFVELSEELAGKEIRALGLF